MSPATTTFEEAGLRHVRAGTLELDGEDRFGEADPWIEPRDLASWVAGPQRDTSRQPWMTTDAGRVKGVCPPSAHRPCPHLGVRLDLLGVVHDEGGSGSGN
jgi:hypothetical protein